MLGTSYGVLNCKYYDAATRTKYGKGPNIKGVEQKPEKNKIDLLREKGGGVHHWTGFEIV